MTSLILPTADTAMMNLFLEHVGKTFMDYFIVMRVDQAGWHQAKALKVPENIRLLPQPPYSPEVNPVEHLWEELREKYFHHRIFSSLDLLSDERGLGLNELTADKARLTRDDEFSSSQCVCVEREVARASTQLSSRNRMGNTASSQCNTCLFLSIY